MTETVDQAQASRHVPWLAPSRTPGGHSRPVGLGRRSTASVIEPSVPEVHVHGSGATDTALPEYGAAVMRGGHLAILRNG